MLMLLWSQAASAATASVFPTGPKQVSVGQTFQVAFQVTDAVDVDTIRLNGSYPQNLLKWGGSAPSGVFQNVSPGTFANEQTGVFSFGAFTMSDHANGTVKIAVITFRALQTGTATIQMSPGSHILSAGEEQLGSLGKLDIQIVPSTGIVLPEQPRPIPPTLLPGETAVSLYSLTHPDPNDWYQSSTVNIGWAIAGKKAESLYFGFDQSPDGPAETLVRSSTMEFTADKDGVWYVHLLIVYADKTKERTDLRVQIDGKPPGAIFPIVDQTEVAPEIPNALRYSALDGVSGISHYDIYLNGKFVTSTASTAYPLTNLKPGTYEVAVTAYDRAGNSSQGTTTFHLVGKISEIPSTIIDWLRTDVAAFLGLITLLLLIFIPYRRRKREEENRRPLKKKSTRE